MKPGHLFRRVCVVGFAVFAAACSRPFPLQPLLDKTPDRVVLIGNEQAAPAGAELPEAVVVRVLDAAGEPIANQLVSFQVTAGGGEVFAGHAMTSDEGFAREWWTLGPVPGENLLEVRVMDGLSGSSIVVAQFRAIGL